eukprot:g4794.t1
MVRNAMHYNDKKSHVYDTARQLNKDGNDKLQGVDLEARRAIFLSHVNGPEAAALDEAQEFRSYGLPIPMNPFLMIPTSIPTIDGFDATVYDDEQEYDDGYSSFSETDGEEETQGLGCPSQAIMSSTLSASPMKEVVYQCWDKIEPWESRRNSKSEFESDEEWNKSKSDLEWKSKWLFLRIKELRTQLDHYSLLDTTPDDDYVKYRYERTPVPDIGTCEALKEHSFFMRHFTTALFDKMEIDSIDQGEDSCEEESFPARVYLNLSTLAEETPKLEALLSARFRMSQTRMLPSDGRALKREPTPRRTPSMQGLVGPKRPRRDDLDAHQSISFATGITGAMERPLRPDITTPNVKELTQSQLEDLQRAKKLIKERIELGLDLQLPEEMQRKILDDTIDDTSEEDISDAIYMEKHKEMEVAEKERHLCVFGPSNGTKAHQLKKGTNKHSALNTSHSLRQSNRPGRGRIKSRRPVGRPPLATRRHPPFPQNEGTFLSTPPPPQTSLDDQEMPIMSAPMSGTSP